MNLPDNTILQGGRYKILNFISSGGFGCTYRAMHVKLGKYVAIKEFFVKDFCNRDESTASVSVGTASKIGLVKRLSSKFCEEAQALSQFNHPGIVRVTDVFDENGTSYFVMDFIEGHSLNEILKEKGKLPESIALNIITQVADALRYVHKNNRLHLDIKPGNIMVDKHGRAILIDFGASKQYDEVDGENTSTLLGKTPGYAPIEQMGNDVIKFNPATDIYALGATFYKMLSGKTPKSATLRVSGDELEALPADTSPCILQAIMASMQLNKKQRPQSIDEFLAILNDDSTLASDLNDSQISDVLNYLSNVSDTPDTMSLPSSGSEHISQSSLSAIEPAKPDTSDKDSADISKSGDNGKNKKVIISIAAALVVVVGVVLGIKLLNKPGDTSANNGSDDVETETAAVETIKEVTDSLITNPSGETFRYTGPVNSAGMPDGKGKGVSSDGEKIYEGDYVNGLCEGTGTYTISGDVISGTFKDNDIVEGRYTWDDGSYFEGTFKNGAPEDGKLYDKNGRQTGAAKYGRFYNMYGRPLN